MQVLTDQLFNYRKSPALQDGVGRFDKIKGKTICWNQLEKELNTTNYSFYRCASSSMADGVATFTASAKDGALYGITAARRNLLKGRTYLLSVDIKGTSSTNGIRIRLQSDADGAPINSTVNLTNAFNTYSFLITTTKAYTSAYVAVDDQRASGFDEISVKNIMLFDLTLLNCDAITDNTSFRSFFPLPYYDYCEGTLISLGGRSINFNQLVQNGNFSNATGWESYGVSSLSVSNNKCKVTFSMQQGNVSGNKISLILNHIYYITVTIQKSNANENIQYGIGYAAHRALSTDAISTSKKYSNIFAASATTSDARVIIQSTSATGFGENTISNYMLVDLTQMFGPGREPSVQGFESLFPDPYYAYTLSKYMNLVSNVSLKTQNKNFFIGDQQYTCSGTANRWSSYMRVISGQTYVISMDISRISGVAISNYSLYVGAWIFYDNNYNQIIRISSQVINNFDTTTPTRYKHSVTAPDGAYYVRYNFSNNNGDGNLNIHKENIQLEFGISMTSYEVHKESTLSLPILDYFPDGEMSARNVCDELTKTGYKKMVAVIDLGRLSFSTTQDGWTQATGIPGVVAPSTSSQTANIVCSKYITDNADSVYMRSKDKSISINNHKTLQLYDSDFAGLTGTEIQQILSGEMLYYEIEIPLENYGVIDLGSLNYYIFSGTTSRFYSHVSSDADMKPAANTGLAGNILCYKYLVCPQNNITNSNGRISIDSSTPPYINIYDTNYTDTATLKESLSGLYLLYEKNNPQPLVPEDPDDYYIFDAWKDGTEQLLPENTQAPVTAPILADMSYSSGKVEVITHPNPIPGGETSGDGWFLVGDEATINAVPNEHYIFKNWELDNEVVSTDPEYTFEVENE